MRMSIIGLQFSGKTTFFEILTSRGIAGAASGKKGGKIGTVFVPDRRLEHLNEIYNPKKCTAATFEFIDCPALSAEGQGQSLSGATLEDVKKADALCLILGAFNSPMAPHPKGSVDPARDLGFLLDEFIMADYVMTEKRAERLRKQVQVNRDAGEQRELDALEKVIAALEDGKPARSISLTEQEHIALSPYQLISLKPLLVVLNIGEDEIGNLDARIAELTGQFPDHTITAMCASIEEELSHMEAEDAGEFMAAMGLHDTAFDRIIRCCFETLGLKVFLTVGHDECRAWPVVQTSTAFDCAGAIHSDLQRGFIRAVVMPYSEFESAPDVTTFKTQSRQEKKDYLVKDGDIMEIRFSV